MCARFTFLSYDEVADVIRELRLTSAPNPLPDWPAVHGSAYPKMPVTVIRPALPPAEGGPRALEFMGSGPQRRGLGEQPAYTAPLEPVTLTWGYDASWSHDVIFNTRIESASKAYWKDSFAHRRCIVPCMGFYEPHQSETVLSPRSGKPIKRIYLFTDPEGAVLLMAGVWKDDRFSVVTTTPNESVAAVHNRMPLIVRPDELSLWFSEDYPLLADRHGVVLDAEGEEAPMQLTLERGSDV